MVPFNFHASARIARKNYISACLFELTTFLQVLACSDFNIKCLVAYLAARKKKLQLLACLPKKLPCSPVLTATI